MSRINKKFTWTTDDDLCLFYKKIEPQFEFEYVPYRNTTLNSLNISRPYRIYQGKYNVEINPDKFSLTTKLGMYTKTRKPFFFRSKKKKR